MENLNRTFGTRLFKGEDGSIIFVNEKDIETEYNCYGLYQKNNSFKDDIIEYKEYRNYEFEAFKEENENYTLDDVKDFIERFNEEHEYHPDGFYPLTGRPQLYIKIEGDYEDCLRTDLSNVYFDDFTKVTYENYHCYDEYYEFWDGHNFRKIYLTSENYDTNFSEITSEFEGIEGRWEECGGNNNLNDTRGTRLYYDSETDTLWAENWSNWQGEGTDYNILEYDFLKDIGDLKKGEKIYIDDNAICFEYRGEQYHFSIKELFKSGEWGHDDYFELDLDIAREAIRTRRIQGVQDKFAINNYEKVLSLPLDHIYVEYADSIAAGNCEEISTRVRNQISEQIGANGDFSLRADELLKYRDDNYSRKAILAAYLKKSKN
jgi:hypothetical protein